MAKRWQRLSPEQVRELWVRWKAGWRLEEIGKVLEHHAAAVHDVIARSGGIAPRARRRSSRALRLDEREEISRGMARRSSIRAIARALGRAPSTICREIRRHGGEQHYRAAAADRLAWRHAMRPKRCRLAADGRLRRVVARGLEADWSPQQIARWLVMTYPDEPSMWVSHETIYRTLYVQARGALKKELVQHLRQRHVLRRSRGRARLAQGRAKIVDAISIAERPPSVDARALPGHWEGDLLMGTHWSQIATLVERHSRFVLLVRLPHREASQVARALIRRVRHLPAGLMKSLTWDRGMEMAQHRRFTIATDVQVYFCDPHSPWQRGSNENTNGLLRQYFPKGMDLTRITQRQLDAVALKLNTRPRETLGWRTPAAVLSTTVASTG